LTFENHRGCCLGQGTGCLPVCCEDLSPATWVIAEITANARYRPFSLTSKSHGSCYL